MNTTKSLVFAVLIALSTSGLSAEKLFMMHGFKLGQSFSVTSNQFGAPFKTEKFPDGFSYAAYKFPGYVLIFEANNTRPDLIWAIQLEGKSNPKGLGFYGIDLGDSDGAVLKRFGKPLNRTPAVDEATKKPIASTEYYSYENFSFEISNGKVTSIKVTFDGPIKNNSESFDLKAFVANLAKRDLTIIAPYLSADFVYSFQGSNNYIKKSIFEALSENRAISDIFFNQEYGIISIKESDIMESAMRIQVDPKMAGRVYKIQKNTVNYEIFVALSYDGWTIRYINRSK